MHEYSLTKQIVKIVCDAALNHQAQGVNSVSLVIGDSTGIIPESVQMYFDMIAADTVAAGAKLNIKTVETKMYCPQCRKDFIKPRFSFECPDCKALGTPTGIGSEFYVESVELEV